MRKAAKAPREESVIFRELEQLCQSPGYIHAIAYLCFRDNVIRYRGEMKAEDMQHMFSRNRLVRTETSILIGLMLKQHIDRTLPTADVLDGYLRSTQALLEEIHEGMSGAIFAEITPAALKDASTNPFTKGAALREPIFYGGESAYSFQYRDFSPAKYGRDDEWLIANQGFSILDARNVVHAVCRLLDTKSIKALTAMRSGVSADAAYLTGISFSTQEVADFGQIELGTVGRVLKAFSTPPSACNAQFKALNDFNVVNASPIVTAPDGGFTLFHIYSLVEALYETPFYWLGADKSYVDVAMKNRGLFTEQFAIERLTKVFGAANVLPNIDIFESKGKRLGEIDALVLFGDRAIVLQAKSKRLTLEARRGNDLRLKDDFKKSIQNSSDQAYLCAELMEKGGCSFRDASGNEIKMPPDLKRIYVLCMIADHYPALSFQARQFLVYTPTATISPPFVMDVFALDAMTEMLESPLQLLSYIDRRTGYTEKILASHELTILSYHLKQNLWVQDEHSMVFLEDDISADLDLAMLARRDGINAKRTPDGVLTRFAATAVGRMTKEIEASPKPETIDLGFLLLTLSEDTISNLSKGIDQISRQALADGKSHDCTLGFGRGESGLTVHCNSDPIEISSALLQGHCLRRKYTERAQSWFGVCLQPKDQAIRFGVNLNFPWEHDDDMDVVTKGMGRPRSISSVIPRPVRTGKKVRPNEPCTCGSGKKAKKCCYA